MAKKDKKKDSEKDDQLNEETVGSQEQEADTLTVEEKIKEELQAEKDKFLRLFAEFENYKKRTSKERIELFKTANQELMTVLLPVMDDFDRGISEIKKAGDSELLKGMELISNKLNNTLTQKGLSKVEVNVGDVFDVELHEAITQIPSPTDDMKGKIIDVVEPGYKLGDKIIRYPKVVVGQ